MLYDVGYMGRKVDDFCWEVVLLVWVKKLLIYLGYFV